MIGFVDSFVAGGLSVEVVGTVEVITAAVAIITAAVVVGEAVGALATIPITTAPKLSSLHPSRTRSSSIGQRDRS